MEMNLVVPVAAVLIAVALVIAVVSWRHGLGWLPAFLVAIPAAIWLPAFFFSPYRRPDLLWEQLAGWPLLPIGLAAAWTLRRRVQWYAWDSRNFIASLVLGWLAAALVARGGLEVFWKLPELLASTATDGLDPALYRTVVLAMLPVMAWALWMIGVAAGRLLGLPLIALLRRTRGLGYYSTRLKFRHRPGEETVEWHFLGKGKQKGWHHRDVPLRRLASFLHESRTDRVFERTYQTFEARGRFSGEQISGTIEGPGQWVNRTRFTGKSHLTLGDLSMELPTGLAVGANKTIDLLYKRYVSALHIADKEQEHRDLLAARAQREADEALARQQAIDAEAAQRQHDADEAVRHQARVEQSRLDAHANLQALLAQAQGEDEAARTFYQRARIGWTNANTLSADLKILRRYQLEQLAEALKAGHLLDPADHGRISEVGSAPRPAAPPPAEPVHEQLKVRRFQPITVVLMMVLGLIAVAAWRLVHH